MKYAEPVQVTIFTGCTVNYIDPSIGMDSLSVLLHNGIEVLYPQQHCCGVPLRAYGDDSGFEKKAAFNIRSLSDAACDIVTPCTSCAHALKVEYPASMNNPEVRDMANHTYDIMEYLVKMRERGILNTVFRFIDMHVIYHAPCHLRCLGKDLIDARLRLLQLIPGIRLEWIDRGCCGMGGTFGMKKKNYQISKAIGEALAEEIDKAKPDLVITECPGCKMQIEHISNIPGSRIQHPIYVLREAYGL